MSIGLPSQSSPLEFLPSPGNSAILVVDEDPAFQLGLKTFLHEYVGFGEVFTAKNGQEALELIENEESIEVVTLDFQMPGMNGIEVLEELRDTAPRVLSVTMITGYPSEELEEEFRSFASSKLLTNYFLSKPVEFEKLEPLILRAHEELGAAKRSWEESEEADDVMEEEESAVPSESIQAQLEKQNEKLEEIERKIENLKKRWRGDFWTLVVLGGLVWAAFHFGWIQKLEPTWENVKAGIVRTFAPATAADSSPGKPTETSPEPSAAEPQAPGLPKQGNPDPGNSGRPL